MQLAAPLRTYTVVLAGNRVVVGVRYGEHRLIGNEIEDAANSG